MWDPLNRFQSSVVSWNDKTLIALGNKIDDSIFVKNFGIGDQNIVFYQDPVTDSVSIRANFSFEGDADYYKGQFLQGVQGNWSGSFKQYDLSTYVGESSNGINVNIGHVNLNAENDCSYMMRPGCGWSPDNPGSIVMRTGDSREGGKIYTATEFEWVSAHEFGHILGVGDAYNSQNSTGVKSIYQAFGTGVQPGDISKVLQAQSTGQWQIWP